ncbi:MAG TPA: glycine cleavage system aminomethyltransferase GcvT [Dehalococcoidia bacterium]|nr:glycine cleavage system aminomethyltransferase GcvT [Dehalococcoidia bacterium]
MSDSTLLRTPLYDEHLRLGARMVPFAGWEMPLQYSGIIEEHHAVRRSVGMFDVSHMGRFEVRGPGAASGLRRLCTYAVDRLSPGQGHYSFLCNEAGGALDDIYVFRLAQDRFLVVANAANAAKVWGWLLSHLPPGAEPVDRHRGTAMVAVQGPRAVATCATALSPALASLPRRGCAELPWGEGALFASRTGYTGEDGLELVTEAEAGPALWRRLLEAGVTPCGLGARDTLRLEAALPLYGQDIDEGVNPFELGLSFAVSLDDGADFIGREALLQVRDEGPRRLLACLRATERGIMRAGYPIYHQGQEVGKVTSGGYSPSLGTSIGLGFLPPPLAKVGTALTVGVRGQPLPVQVVPRPFYRPPRP